MQKKNVLFLCTGNSCRSIMAEAILRERASDRFNVFSAGTAPTGVNPLSIHVLQEMGVETDSLRSKSVNEYLGRLPAHYVITVCHGAQESCPRIFSGAGQRMCWPVDDPPACPGTDEEHLDEFREVRAQIDKRIQGWLDEVGPGDTR
jgi:arsenate reductase